MDRKVGIQIGKGSETIILGQPFNATRKPLIRQSTVFDTSPCERSFALSPDMCFIIPGGPQTCATKGWKFEMFR